MTISRITMSILSISCAYMLSTSQVQGASAQPTLATQRNTPAITSQKEEAPTWSSLKEKIEKLETALSLARLSEYAFSLYLLSITSIKEDLNRTTVRDYPDGQFDTKLKQIEKAIQELQDGLPRKPLNNISLHPHGKHPKA